MNSEIVLITCDKILATRAIQVSKENNEKIEIYLAENEGRAWQAICSDTNLLISRGKTAEMIKEKSDIPIVKIETSYLNIISTIGKALKYSNNIGVIGPSDLMKRVNEVKEVLEYLLPINIITDKLDSTEDISTEIQKLINNGAEVFIGIMTAENLVRKLGYRFFTLQSRKQDIILAINKAKYLHEVQKKEKEKTELLKSIINSTNTGLIAADGNNKISVLNTNAEEMIGFNKDEAIGKSIDKIFAGNSVKKVFSTTEAVKNTFHKIGKTTFNVKSTPIIVDGVNKGIVATFEEIEKIQDTERNIRKNALKKNRFAKYRFTDIIGDSYTLQNIKDRASQYAKVDSTVLIFGETGTGKELFAQSIHNASNRANKPFVAVNCAAFPEALLESELFGYVEGAFTGAKKGGKLGLFELAHEGTIFLDEVSAMPLKIQSRFLRVLQEKEVIRVGDNKIINVDVRIIAATNKDLISLVEQGIFRDDLYYRLCVLQLSIPPLRERIDDISKLANYFLSKKTKDLGKDVKIMSKGALNQLMLYHWPGNIRQLENIIERLVVLSNENMIDEQQVADALDSKNDDINDQNKKTDIGILKQTENNTIIKVLKECGGNKTLAADKLGINVTTLWRKLKTIENKSFSDSEA